MAGSTAAMTGGTEVSGLPMNRDNQSAPDAEQRRREAAREESEWAAGSRPDHPAETRAFQNDYVKAENNAEGVE